MRPNFIDPWVKGSKDMNFFFASKIPILATDFQVLATPPFTFATPPLTFAAALCSLKADNLM
jgi:hypothetical protein